MKKIYYKPRIYFMILMILVGIKGITLLLSAPAKINGKSLDLLLLRFWYH